MAENDPEEMSWTLHHERVEGIFVDAGKEVVRQCRRIFGRSAVLSTKPWDAVRLSDHVKLASEIWIPIKGKRDGFWGFIRGKKVTGYLVSRQLADKETPFKIRNAELFLLQKTSKKEFRKIASLTSDDLFSIFQNPHRSQEINDLQKKVKHRLLDTLCV